MWPIGVVVFCAVLQAGMGILVVTRWGLSICVAAPALFMLLSLLVGAQHAAFQLCLAKVSGEALSERHTNVAAVRSLNASLKGEEDVARAYARTAALLHQRCQAGPRTRTIEAAIGRMLWAQFIRIEAEAPVLTIYAAHGVAQQRTAFDNRNQTRRHHP